MKDPAAPTVNPPSQARPERTAVCEVYPLTNYYRIHVDLANWPLDKHTSGQDFERILKQRCGADNISDFSCALEGPGSAQMKFYITYPAKARLPKPMDTVLEDVVHQFSGNQITIKCRRPGL